MTGRPADQVGPARRWLRFSLGEKKSALRLDCLVRVLDQIELFLLPFLPKEFKGVIYFNEQAVPIVNWEIFGIKSSSGGLVMILEQGKDWIGMEVKDTGKVEEYRPGPGAKENGFWIELDSEKGIWGLDEEKFFKTLRQDHSWPED